MAKMSSATRRRRRSSFANRVLGLEPLEQRRLLAVLTEGMVVGGVTNDEARVFFRTNEAASGAIEYSTSPTFASSTTSPVVNTAVAADFTGIVPLTGLAAETTYYYRAVIDGVPDARLQSFATFAAAGDQREFSFAITSDLKNASSNPTVPAPAYHAIDAHDPSFLMQIGDFDHRNPKSLSAMRLMHRQVRSDLSAAGADFATVADKTPVFHVWDDHDFTGNNSDKTARSTRSRSR